MASGRSRTITAKFVFDDSDKRKVDNLSDSIDGPQGLSGSFTGIAGAARGLLAGAAAGAVVSFGTDMFQLAANAEVVENRVNTVFGNMASQIEEFAEQNRERFGVSSVEVQSYASSVGDLLIPLGFTREEAAKLSTEILTTADALADFNGKPFEQAVEAMTAALLGEREQLKQFGISISQADVDAARATGAFANMSQETERAGDVLSTLSLIIDNRAVDALAAATTGANEMKDAADRLASNWSELKQEVADTTSGPLTALVTVGADVVGVLGNISNGFTQQGGLITGVTEATLKGNDFVDTLKDIRLAQADAYQAQLDLTQALHDFVAEGRDLPASERDPLVLYTKGVVDLLEEEVRRAGEALGRLEDGVIRTGGISLDQVNKAIEGLTDIGVVVN